MQKLVTALIGGLVLACLGQGVSAEVLITADEAKLPASANTGTVMRSITRGPGIDQELPGPNQRVRSPLPLKVKFQTRNNVAIDQSTVRVTYLKAPLVDLTGRIKKYIRADGIEIGQAEVPPGVHFLRFDLKDIQGREGSAVIKLTVADR